MKNTAHNQISTEERSQLLVRLLLERLRASDEVLHCMLTQAEQARAQQGMEFAYRHLHNNIEALHSLLLSPATEICIDSDSPLLQCFQQPEGIAFAPVLHSHEREQYAALAE